MKLTIIPVDGAVGKDKIFYTELNLESCDVPADVQALQWDNGAGWIEFTDSRENEYIIQLPSWATACVSIWDAKDYLEKNPPPPTPEHNAQMAKQLLADSDWTQLPDVSLANKSEWDAYRQALRVIAVEPTVDPTWPIKPLVIWL